MVQKVAKKEGGKTFSGRLICYKLRNEKETRAEMFIAVVSVIIIGDVLVSFWPNYSQ